MNEVAADKTKELIKQALEQAYECPSCSSIIREETELPSDDTLKKIHTIRNIPIGDLVPRVDSTPKVEILEEDREALEDEERDLVFKSVCLDSDYKRELQELNEEINVWL